MKEYITSDVHCLHNNIIKYAERTKYFPESDQTSAQMSWDIVNSINEQIPDEKGVILWNLGDLFYGKLFGSKTLSELQVFVSTMKGRNRQLNIVLGNHDKQFNQFRSSKEDWAKVHPINKHSTLENIFQCLGFDKVYDRPVLYKDRFILSHEPVFIKPGSNIRNIHGHTHQYPVDASYFTYDLENYKMVRKAYKDSGRVAPTLQQKIDWEKFVVDTNYYTNVCWDFTKGKVLSLDEILQESI